jgi:hypothetical protein
MAHPRGLIQADLRREGARIVGTVALPAGVEGTFVAPDGSETALAPGTTRIA